MSIEMDEFGDYRDDLGTLYVKSGKRQPVFVKVEESVIQGRWRRVNCKLDLTGLELPKCIVTAAYQFAISRLETCVPTVLIGMDKLMRNLAANWKSGWLDFSSLSLPQLIMLLAEYRKDLKTHFRKFYMYCAIHGFCGADESFAIELEALTFSSAKPMLAVLQWHETKGAMTAAEQEVVRTEMINKKMGETITETTSRLYTWILFETLKRPSQVGDIEFDALWRPSSSNDSQYFLRIPKAKYQAGQSDEMWPITRGLAHAIVEYSAHDFVRMAQKETGYLLVSSVFGFRSRLGVNLNKWFKARKIISPRTLKPLVITPYRIRHTGATQMAMLGASAHEIQYILEHRTPYAVQVYIDSLASELCPLIDQVGRRLGGLFSSLNDFFFQGAISSEGKGAPILIPSSEQPAVVGGCSKKTTCNKHPFFQCYNGCRYFLAWREADHTRSLSYLEGELERWRVSEGRNERSKVIKDLEQVYRSVLDVVERIKKGG